ncbi:hypothetical protein [Haloflavibacter putidus]|uniref:hypothetical protein n=1 Tax=Haloflavibacter putidus TaxID=2576776 RepID=UPI001F2129F4|nr:hypothetical protein [Haloflavibacter putidus]
MAKLYLNPSKEEKTAKPLRPKKETIDFLLNYSKALCITNSKNAMQFDTLLN